jgi:RimJ/RimL family protein N-acetyltransferase
MRQWGGSSTFLLLICRSTRRSSLPEHAAFFVEELAIAGWDAGTRYEFLAEDAATGERLGRVGLGIGHRDAAEIGYWMDPRARGRGVATDAVRAISGWAFRRLGPDLIEWRAEVGNDAWVGSLLKSEATQ